MRTNTLERCRICRHERPVHDSMISCTANWFQIINISSWMMKGSREESLFLLCTRREKMLSNQGNLASYTVRWGEIINFSPSQCKIRHPRNDHFVTGQKMVETKIRSEVRSVKVTVRTFRFNVPDIISFSSFFLQRWSPESDMMWKISSCVCIRDQGVEHCSFLRLLCLSYKVDTNISFERDIQA